MKKSIVSLVLIFGGSIILGCNSNNNSVKKIKLIIDPNKRENKYRVVYYNDKDSIQEFMKKFNNKNEELFKFYPRYSIEIFYENKVDKFLGNANHIKDEKGNTYKLLTKSWEIFNY